MLTEHQSSVLEQALEILKTEDRLLIKGSAGVGKTFLVEYLLRELAGKSYGTNILCTAPTNEAVKVLRDKISMSVSFSTVHQALKWKRFTNPTDGTYFFKSAYDKRSPPLRDVSFLVIDETSMILLNMLFDIEKYAQMYGVKIIFLGDDKQLRPVGEKFSSVFYGKPTLVKKQDFIKDERFFIEQEEDIVVFDKYPEVELTEIVRQKGDNPIINLSRNLDTINSKIPLKNEYGGFIYTSDRDKIVETLAYVNGTNDLKYLAFTNREVNDINTKVRKKIYGTPQKIEVGETLIFNTPYRDGEYSTGDKIKVDKVMVRETLFTYRKNREETEEKILKYYSINYHEYQDVSFDSSHSWDSKPAGNNISDNVIVIHEDSEEDFQKIHKILKSRAASRMITWDESNAFYEQFADLKYNHAMTVHKSQGSTFKQVILNVRDIKISRDEVENLLYTGVTRASDLLILYNV